MPWHAAVAFEIRRSISVSRAIVVVLLLLATGLYAFSSLDIERSFAGGQLPGSTAWDVYYLALTTEMCSSIFLPGACLIACADMFSRDHDGWLQRLVALRGGNARSFWLGKMAAIAVLCTIINCVALVLMMGVNAFVFHESLAATCTPAWLSYSGNPDDFLLSERTGLPPIPASWCYPLFIFLCLCLETCVCVVITLFFLAMTTRSRVRFMAAFLGAGAALVLLVLPSIGVRLNFLYSWMMGLDTLNGFPDKGYILDRFCLRSYALGAGLWETRAGGPALLARELAIAEASQIDPATFPEGYLDTIAQGTTVNSFGSLAVILLVVGVGSAAWLYVRCRRSFPQVVGRRSNKMNSGTRPVGCASSHLVEVCDVAVCFGSKTVLSNVNLCIEQGDVIGLMGRNGSGKTTLLNVIAGLLVPKSGNVTTGVFKRDASDERSAVRCGFMFDEPRFIEQYDGATNLLMLARYCGVKNVDVDVLMRRVGLDAENTTKVRSYSLGMRKRLCLAFALLGDPPLLLLDEPFNGLDPGGIACVRGIIEEVTGRGRAVVLSSHLLSELQRLCTRIYFVGGGAVEPVTEAIGADGLEAEYLRRVEAG